jgi:hypothetical protein
MTETVCMTCAWNGAFISNKPCGECSELSRESKYKPTEDKPMDEEDWLKQNYPDYDRGGTKFGLIAMLDAFRTGAKEDRKKTQPVIDAAQRVLDSNGRFFNDRTQLAEALAKLNEE